MGLLDRILHIQLYGGVSSRMTENLFRALRYKQLYSIQLIAVSINSAGGSLTQAKNINAIIRNFSRKTGAPIFTFAEDVCLNAANSILTSGNRCFANEFSLLGDFAFTFETYGIKNLLEKYNVKVETIEGGKNKFKLNMFEDLKEEDSKWLQNLLYEHEYELKTEIINHRGNTFQHLGLTNQNVEEKIFNAPVLDAQNALQYGIIDGISSLERVVHDKYHGTKVMEIMKAGQFTEGSPKSSANLINNVGSAF